MNARVAGRFNRSMTAGSDEGVEGTSRRLVDKRIRSRLVTLCIRTLPSSSSSSSTTTTTMPLVPKSSDGLQRLVDVLFVVLSFDFVIACCCLLPPTSPSRSKQAVCVRPRRLLLPLPSVIPLCSELMPAPFGRAGRCQRDETHLLQAQKGQRGSVVCVGCGGLILSTWVGDLVVVVELCDRLTCYQ